MKGRVKMATAFIPSALFAYALVFAACTSGPGPSGIEPLPGPTLEEWTVTPLANGTAACSFQLENFRSGTHSFNMEVTPLPAIAPSGYPIALISCSGTPRVLEVSWCRVTGTSLDCPGAGGSTQALIFRPDVTYTATAKIIWNSTGQVIDSKSVIISGVE